MDNSTLIRLLDRVEKPARYIGGEWNSIVKEDAKLRFALCFPDVYEIGMSHLGSRILYHILNGIEDVACERCYAPWPDMEKALREEKQQLFTLETKRSVGKCDIVGFSLLYEMCYTNILTMLDLGGIPFRTADRGEDDPLIVCGGPCACNPEPIAPFMDAVMIGDGEEMIVDLVNAYRISKQLGETRACLLERLSHIDGVYVPSLVGGVETKDVSALPVVSRRILKDLDAAPFVGKPIVPYMSITHDRVSLEVMRGCPNGCRFCQAGFIYRPVRERSVDTLMSQAAELISCTGYDEISLLSLSTGDYSEVHELIPKIIDGMAEKHVSVSLPSLRIDSIMKDDLEKMQSIRKAGLTFAPEAGTQRLRDVINKNVTEEDLLRACNDAFTSGWSSVKLYFMIGLPTETDEDILGIADLCKKVSKLYYSLPKESRGKALRISASASTFVPKPFTPFQWFAQVPLDEIRRRQTLLRNAMKGIRGVEFHCHLSELSVLEAAFSRGDRSLSDVLEIAYKKGCRFDSWSEYFRSDLWREAFSEIGKTMEDYACRTYPTDRPLPWSHIDMVVTEKYLLKEYQKAMSAGETTRGCYSGCNGCFGGRYADVCRLSKK